VRLGVWTGAAVVVATACLPPDVTGANCYGAHTCPVGLACEPERRVCGTPVTTCVVANGGCDVNAACTTLPRGAVCACLEGFVGDGLSCVLDHTRLASLKVDFGVSPVAFGFEPRTRWYQVAPPLDAVAVRVKPEAEFPGLVRLAVNGQPLASGEVARLPVVGLQALAEVTVSDGAGAITTYTVAVQPGP
jgi:hypothetical protein